MFFASSAVLALAVASVSAHSIHHVRRHHAARATPPAGWATGYLEEYDVYHERYIAVGCENKHNTTFFDMCCHPMLATETLAKNRAPCCAPGSAVQCPSSSSSAAAPASTDDDDCDDEDEGEDASSTVAATTPSSTGSVDDGDDDDCDDEDGEDASSTVTSKGASSTSTGDDDDDCEEDGDDDSSATTAVDHATKAATSTHPVVSPASTHSSSEAAPTTTHTTHKTTTTAKASPTSTAEQSTKTTSSTSSSSGDLVTGGFATWFTQNGVAGACGTVHKDTDLVVALPTVAYQNGANCGRKIRVYKADDNTHVDAVVADECPTCDNKECVDMSVAAFEALASLPIGQFSIKYEFLD